MLVDNKLGSLYFSFLAVPHGMWDLSSPTRAETCAPAMEVQNLNHWTTREVPAPIVNTF